MNPLYKILSISAISVICASNVCAQGKSLAFSNVVVCRLRQTRETRKLDKTIAPIYKYIFHWNTENEDWRDVDGAATIRAYLSRYLEHCRQEGFYEFNNINAFDITDDGAYFTIKPITK